jgi:hypothetical protein
MEFRSFQPLAQLPSWRTTSCRLSATINSLYSQLPSLSMSRDSTVGIATVYGLDDKRGQISSPDRVKNFLFSTSSRPVLGSTQPPVQWVPGAVSHGVKQLEREADHSSN